MEFNSDENLLLTHEYKQMKKIFSIPKKAKTSKLDYFGSTFFQRFYFLFILSTGLYLLFLRKEFPNKLKIIFFMKNNFNRILREDTI